MRNALVTAKAGMLLLLLLSAVGGYSQGNGNMTISPNGVDKSTGAGSAKVSQVGTATNDASVDAAVYPAMVDGKKVAPAIYPASHYLKSTGNYISASDLLDAHDAVLEPIIHNLDQYNVSKGVVTSAHFSKITLTVREIVLSHPELFEVK